MPRKSRLDIPGLLQHVIVRGIERKKIFTNDDDCVMFVNRFSSLLEETDTDCYAWALIPNHFHLLLRPNQVALSTFMRRLLTGYAINFNHRYKRSGHLFQNRYKSIVCEEESYLLELVRYIHLNPLRAKLVAGIDNLDGYPWSGHAVLMGNRELAGQKTEEVLLRFGKRIVSSRRHYRQFMEDGLAMGKRTELVGGGLRRSKKAAGEPVEGDSHDDRILGSGAFVDNLRHERGLKERISYKMSLTDLLGSIVELYGIEREDIRWRSRKTVVSEARAVFCYAAVRVLGVSGADAGKMLNIRRSAVSQAVRRGALLLQEATSINSKLESFLLDE
jgi:REP element-mobilizing transposase RayT